MKKHQIMSLALMVICGSAFAAPANFPMNPKSWEDRSRLVVINVCHLTEDTLNEIKLGYHPEMAVEFSAQTILPISFFLKGELVHLVENEVSSGAVEIKQTFYVRCVENELLLSTNLADWKPFLEFLTGAVSFSLNIQDGQPSIVVGAEANRRP